MQGWIINGCPIRKTGVPTVPFRGIFGQVKPCPYSVSQRLSGLARNMPSIVCFSSSLAMFAI